MKTRNRWSSRCRGDGRRNKESATMAVMEQKGGGSSDCSCSHSKSSCQWLPYCFQYSYQELYNCNLVRYAQKEMRSWIDHVLPFNMLSLSSFARECLMFRIPVTTTGLWDTSCTIRLGACAALRACLIVMEKRETRFRIQYHHNLFTEAQKGLILQTQDDSSSYLSQNLNMNRMNPMARVSSGGGGSPTQLHRPSPSNVSRFDKFHSGF